MVANSEKSAAPDAKSLLAWYDRHKRDLPWRPPTGETPDPYHVWLAEIMLQQTTVATVAPYFEKFKTLFPTLDALAAAPDDAVMAAWAGLGYYSRARNLLKCARLLVAEKGGAFPDTQDALLALPGIGDYTAAAIAAIAFNRAAAPVDGNIERVLARLYALQIAPPKLKAAVKARCEKLVPSDRPGDFAQALMDLGATLCTPKRPNCTACPWQKFCVARAEGLTESLPMRPPKKPRPTRKGIIYWLENARGEVLMHRRPDKGLLGGMLAFPSTGWDAPNDTPLLARLSGGAQGGKGARKIWRDVDGEVVHVFTHFRLVLKIKRADAPKNFRKPAAHEWVALRDLPHRALPSVMQKVVRLVVG